jgi:hypothetical protein
MTEAEWRQSTDPNPLLIFLQSRSSDRKRRLLACAFCRDTGQHIQDGRFWRAIEAGESWADERRSPDTEDEFYDDILNFYDDLMNLDRELLQAQDYAALSTVFLAVSCLSDDPLHLFIQSVPGFWGRLREKGRDVVDRLMLGISYRKRKPHPQHWCRFVHDIFGNPFRPVAFNPAWRTDTAVTLARQMYESRDFGAMPILADALQDAGCENEDILNHCRDPKQPHVRGCWVVDLVLGKE